MSMILNKAMTLLWKWILSTFFVCFSFFPHLILSSLLLLTSQIDKIQHENKIHKPPDELMWGSFFLMSTLIDWDWFKKNVWFFHGSFNMWVYVFMYFGTETFNFRSWKWNYVIMRMFLSVVHACAWIDSIDWHDRYLAKYINHHFC